MIAVDGVLVGLGVAVTVVSLGLIVFVALIGRINR